MLAWHLKYRPRQVSELHLTPVRLTLEHLMAGGRFPQALLFAGPKGTGKTSSARIIAAMLNDPINASVIKQLFLDFKPQKTSSLQLQEPDPDSIETRQICNGQSYGVIEIDAASHGLVDDIRLLKERASLQPQGNLMTVYILDEVHMMSTAAFNALLKLLEEPPAHAVFILATTELHKVPSTIVSRCTLVPFRRATTVEILEVFERIVAAEKLTVEPAALERLAELADGSFRDGVKWLELAVIEGGVTLAGVTQLIGANLHQDVMTLIAATLAKDALAVSTLIQAWRTAQVDQSAAAKAVFSYLHDQLLQSFQKDAEPSVAPQVAQFLLIQLLEANLTQASPIAHLALELKLLELIQKAKTKKTPPISSSSENQPPSTKIAPPTKSDPMPETNARLAEPEVCQNLVTHWNEFVTAVATQNASVAALLKQAQPQLSPSGILIQVYYAFHRDQLMQTKFASLYDQAATQVIGQAVPVEIALVASQKVAVIPDVVETSTLSALATEALL